MSSNRIQLKGCGRQEEALAAGTIKPGHLIKLGSGGTVTVQSVEGGISERMFALEDALQGHTMEDSYSSGDLVSFILASPGDVVNAFIKAGANIVPGDLLIAATDGSLIESTSAASATVIKQYIGVALETINLTASGSVATRIAVRVL